MPVQKKVSGGTPKKKGKGVRKSRRRGMLIMFATILFGHNLVLVTSSNMHATAFQTCVYRLKFSLDYTRTTS